MKMQNKAFYTLVLCVMNLMQTRLWNAVMHASFHTKASLVFVVPWNFMADFRWF